MTVKEILHKYNKIEIELLLAYVFKKPKEFVFLHPQVSLSAGQQVRLERLIKRRMAGEPIAYILGYKDFYGLRFKVGKDVLIPRPESEWFIDRVLSVIPSARLQSPTAQAVGGQASDEESLTKKLRDPSAALGMAQARILDVATGSGCIAVSLVQEFKIKNLKFKITASDISPAALKVARENAKTHKAKIKFVKSDLFKNIGGKFDIIIANLPYVPIKIYKKFIADTEIRFEPISALTDGTKSFQIYRRFFEEVGGHINSGGTILLEIDPSSRKFLVEYQKKYLPSAGMKFYKDFNKLWRYAEIKV